MSERQQAGAVTRSRSSLLVGAALGVIAAACWAFVVYLSRSTGGMASGRADTPSMRLGLPVASYDHSAVLVALLFLGMWVVMMAGMMLPSVTPLVATYQRVYRERARAGRASVPAAVLIAGYLAAWAAFGLVAYLVDRGAESWASRSAEVRDAAPVVGGLLLVLAGLYQWTPLKLTCLRWCRTPAHFVLIDWREGRLGAFRMGVRNGWYCIGCCWAMMLALLVVGLMSLPWMALLAVVILIEKNSRFTVPVGHALAVLLIVSGIVLALHPAALPGTML
ncbi:MAG: DUF2182 domain-containing protein [Dehalococcoidia bacterium]